MKALLSILQAILALFSRKQQNSVTIDWYAALQDARIPDLIEADQKEDAARIYAAITESSAAQGKTAIDRIVEQQAQWTP